ncbi:hypothetical protein BH09MYX1_BH09MYX1_27620 [soil metagenome]
MPHARWALASFTLAVVLLGCGNKKPSRVTGAPATPPDESCQLGSVGYQEGFLWTCTGAQHVHVWRTCGEMIGCGSWRLETVSCGAPLATEPVKSTRLPMAYGAWE